MLPVLASMTIACCDTRSGNLVGSSGYSVVSRYSEVASSESPSSEVMFSSAWEICAVIPSEHMVNINNINTTPRTACPQLVVENSFFKILIIK